MGTYTVSFDITETSEEAFAILAQSGYRFEIVGTDRIDMPEEEFFAFKEEVESFGLTLPVDGSSSWEKF